MEDRRSFMVRVSAAMAATSLVAVANKVYANEIPRKKELVHHVFFWLKDPKNIEARQEFEIGLKALVKVSLVQTYHIGTPVESTREVVDDSFTYSYIAFFKNEVDQNIYQTHPIHLKFIEDCQHLWEKVMVYDAMN